MAENTKDEPGLIPQRMQRFLLPDARRKRQAIAYVKQCEQNIAAVGVPIAETIRVALLAVLDIPEVYGKMFYHIFVLLYILDTGCGGVILENWHT